MSSRTTWRTGLSAAEIQAHLRERRERAEQMKLADEAERRKERKELLRAAAQAFGVVIVTAIVVTIAQKLFEMFAAWVKG